MDKNILKELVNHANYLDDNGHIALASLFDFVATVVKTVGPKIVSASDNTKAALIKCSNYMDNIGNVTAGDAIDKALVILAREDIPGRYGPIGQFDSLEYSKKIYDTESTDAKQTKTKRNMEPHIKEFGESGPHLSTRHCPDHYGVQTQRIGERVYQCPLDKKIYNYEVGYKTYAGDDIPGGSVALQTPESSDYFAVPSRIFDSRESLMNPII